MEYNSDDFDNIAARLEIEAAVERAEDSPEALEARVLGRIATTNPATLEKEITETSQEYVRAKDESAHAESQLFLRHATDHLSPESEEVARQTQEAMLNDREQLDRAKRVVHKLILSAHEAYRVREKRRELGKTARRMVFAVPATVLSAVGTLAGIQEGVDLSAPSGWLAVTGIVGLASAIGRSFQKKYGLRFEATAAKKKAAKMLNQQ